MHNYCHVLNEGKQQVPGVQFQWISIEYRIDIELHRLVARPGPSGFFFSGDIKTMLRITTQCQHFLGGVQWRQGRVINSVCGHSFLLLQEMFVSSAPLELNVEKIFSNNLPRNGKIVGQVQQRSYPAIILHFRMKLISFSGSLLSKWHATKLTY